MFHLRVHQCGLTYQGELSPPVPVLIDAPGNLASALVAKFEDRGVGLADLRINEGGLEERGLTCEIGELEASLSLQADLIELRFSSIESTGDARATDAIRSVWQVLSATGPVTSAKSHSLLFEFDCEAVAGSYQRSLDGFCRAPESLPAGTETAVVYYLPREDSRGYLDSNIVLNRSAQLDGGVLLAVNLVFDGKMCASDTVISRARTRLEDLLSRLEVTLSRAGQAE